MSPRCIMGCKLKGQTLHVFPKNPQRRAEWYRILGVYPRIKSAYACNAHFAPHDIFGNRVNRYATPQPPEYRLVNLQQVEAKSERYLRQKGLSISKQTKAPQNRITRAVDDANSSTFPETEISFSETIFKSNTVQLDPLENNNNFNEDDKQENFSKVEDFEIRKGINNDIIIKGHYVQTNDYLVVSYTPPKKFTLQEQVKLLDNMCIKQQGNITRLTRQVNLLSAEIKKYEKLLPKLRHLQSNNRYLYAQLKMYKLNEKNRRKRIKEKRLKKKKVRILDENEKLFDDI